MAVTFQSRLDKLLEARRSLLCVGLDPDPSQFPKPLRRLPPARALRTFLDGIVAATSPSAAAYKLQLGSYLAFGPDGFREMARIVGKIGATRIRILDLKANDIPNTMRMIADGAYRNFGFDAITVSPWLGWETLQPLADDPKHGFFVVAHSSNPGAPDFQEIPTPRGPLWLAVVEEVRRLAAEHGNAGVVVGAPFAEALRQARATLGHGIPILVPGVGAQGGQLATVVREAVDGNGRGLLVNSSRSILYASSGADWKAAAGAEAKRMKGQINQLCLGLSLR